MSRLMGSRGVIFPDSSRPMKFMGDQIIGLRSKSEIINKSIARVKFLLLLAALLPVCGCSPAEAELKLTCLDKQVPGHPSEDLGFSLAAAENRVAISEPSANRVHLLQHDDKGGWKNLWTISHPKAEFLANLRGFGFGYSVAMAGNYLIIGDYVETSENNPGRRLEMKRAGMDGSIRRSGIYLVDLQHSTPRMREVLTPFMPSGSVYGFAVAVSTSHIAASYAMLDRDPLLWRHGGVVVAPIESPDKAMLLKTPKPNQAPFYATSISLDGSTLIASINAAGVPPGALLTDLKSGNQRELLNLIPSPGVSSSLVGITGSTAVLSRSSGLTFDSVAPQVSSAAAAEVFRLGDSSTMPLAVVRPPGPISANHHIIAIAPTLRVWPPELKETRSPLKVVLVRADGVQQEWSLRDWKGSELMGPAQAVAIGRTHLVVSRRAPSGSCKVFAALIPSANGP
jgi:hypothetical protein